MSKKILSVSVDCTELADLDSVLNVKDKSINFSIYGSYDHNKKAISQIHSCSLQDFNDKEPFCVLDIEVDENLDITFFLKSNLRVGFHPITEKIISIIEAFKDVLQAKAEQALAEAIDSSIVELTQEGVYADTTN